MPRSANRLIQRSSGCAFVNSSRVEGARMEISPQQGLPLADQPCVSTYRIVKLDAPPLSRKPGECRAQCEHHETWTVR